MEYNQTAKPQVLPVVSLGGTAYLVDLGQRQFRETMNPSSYVDFDTVKGEQLCRQAGVVTCLRCGMSVIAAPVEELRCMRCGGPVGSDRHK